MGDKAKKEGVKNMAGVDRMIATGRERVARKIAADYAAEREEKGSLFEAPPTVVDPAQALARAQGEADAGLQVQTPGKGNLAETIANLIQKAGAKKKGSTGGA